MVLTTAENTILSKLERAKRSGGSERQLEHAGGILAVKGAALDRAYVERRATVLGVLDLWTQLAGEV